MDFNDRDFAGAYVNEDPQLGVVAVTDHGESLALDAFGDEHDVVISIYIDLDARQFQFL